MRGWTYDRDSNDLDAFDFWDVAEEFDRIRKEKAKLRAQLKERKCEAQEKLDETTISLSVAEEQHINSGKLGGNISGQKRQKERAEELDNIREEFTRMYLDKTVLQIDIGRHFGKCREWVLKTAKFFGIYDPVLARNRRAWKNAKNPLARFIERATKNTG